jgi:hypothetical protein
VIAEEPWSKFTLSARREVRHLLYGNKPHLYRVLFTIQGDVVTVLHVRRPKRQPLLMH